MKKIFRKSIIGAWIFLSCFTPLAHAQTITTVAQAAHLDAASILPANIDMLYEINTAVNNPLKSFIEDALYDTSELTRLLVNLANNHKVTFAMSNIQDTQGQPNMFLTMNMTADDYQKVIDTTQPSETETYGGKTIYTLYSDVYTTMIDDLFIMSDTTDSLKKIIDDYASHSNELTDLPSYQSAMTHTLGDGFITVYMNPSILISSIGPELMQSSEMGISTTGNKIVEALTGESISVGQTDNGFDFSAGVAGDKDKLAAAGYRFDKYNFTPKLYQVLSGKDLIFYQERTNLNAQIADFMKMLNPGEDAAGKINTFKTAFKIETGVDLDRDLLPLLGGNYMITVHNGSQAFPAVTLVFDVGANKDQAGQVMLKLSEYLKKYLQANWPDAYAYNIYTAGGTAFYDFTINLKKTDKSGSLQSVTDDAATLHLRMAVTTDGLAVVSTLPDLNAMFRASNTSLLDNDKLKTEFTNPGNILSDVTYVDIDNLAMYADVLMNIYKTDAQTKTTFDQVIAPWHVFFMRNYGDSQSAWAAGKIIMDVDKLGTLSQLLTLAFTSYSPETPPLETIGAEKKFCDVSTGDWFYPYVSDLSSKDVVSGYPDGCFRPGQPVTRAEFVKMAMIALDKTFPIDPTYKPFNDVPAGDSVWYAMYINEATKLGYVNGYSDGSFKPDATITRAEAVEILYNISTQLKGVNVIDQPLDSLITFQDVKSTDWFFTAVVAAKHYGLVQGVSPQSFAPGKNLTRAQAAKIINILQTLELQAAPPPGGEYVGP